MISHFASSKGNQAYLLTQNCMYFMLNIRHKPVNKAKGISASHSPTLLFSGFDSTPDK